MGLLLRVLLVASSVCLCVIQAKTTTQSQVQRSNRFARQIVEGTLQNVRGGAQVIGDSGNYGYGSRTHQGRSLSSEPSPVAGRSHPKLLAGPRRSRPRITNAHSGIDESVVKQRRLAVVTHDPIAELRPQQQVLRPRAVRRVRRRRPVSFQLTDINKSEVPPNGQRRVARSTTTQSPVQRSNRFARKIVEGTLQNVRGGARLIGASGNYGYVPLVNKLIDNATLIRENIVEGFDCAGKTYGYYADQLNDCQIFHICVPMKQIFPDHFTENDIYHFSFICPKYTIFSQDAMVCAWEGSAVPCVEAHNLYYMNQNFFVVSNDDVQKETTQASLLGGVGYTSPLVQQQPNPYPPQPIPAASSSSTTVVQSPYQPPPAIAPPPYQFTGKGQTGPQPPVDNTPSQSQPIIGGGAYPTPQVDNTPQPTVVVDAAPISQADNTPSQPQPEVGGGAYPTPQVENTSSQPQSTIGGGNYPTTQENNIPLQPQPTIGGGAYPTPQADNTPQPTVVGGANPTTQVANTSSQPQSTAGGGAYPTPQGDNTSPRPQTTAGGGAYPTPQGDNTSPRPQPTAGAGAYPIPQRNNTSSQPKPTVGAGTYPNAQGDNTSSPPQPTAGGEAYPTAPTSQPQPTVGGGAYPTPQGYNTSSQPKPTAGGGAYPTPQGNNTSSQPKPTAVGDAYPTSQADTTSQPTVMEETDPTTTEGSTQSQTETTVQPDNPGGYLLP